MDERFCVRKVHNDDLRAVFELSNAPSVRESSFHPALIPWEDHFRWFEKVRADPECGYYVAEINGVVAGQVRFKREGEAAIVSISVGPAFRGRGIGDRLYREAFADYRLGHPVARIEARIRKDNAPSAVFFRKLGFFCMGEAIFNGMESQILGHHLSPSEESQ
jgi:RimJ/RimL family protein N-acetyltransferase